MTSVEAPATSHSGAVSRSGSEDARLAVASEGGSNGGVVARDNSLHVESAGSTRTGDPQDSSYVASFLSRQHLMPHWRNVLARPRNRSCGSVTVLSFSSSSSSSQSGGLTLQSSHELSSYAVNPSSLTAALTPDLNAGLEQADSNVLSSLPRAVLVSDLSEPLINSLGPIFRLSPETFEEHLIRSGYTSTSYQDRDSSTWPTRFLPKQHVSLRWHSLVSRKDTEPRDASSRRVLMEDMMEWRRSFGKGPGGKIMWHTRLLSKLTNIFRQEWSLSPTSRPLKRRLVMSDQPRGLIDIGEGDEFEEVEKGPRADEELDVVAWEERVTFCWGSWNQGRCPILFFDPLPRMLLNDRQVHQESKWVNFVPFSKRLAPRGPPPAQEFDHAPAALDAVSAYANSTSDALSDAAAWVRHLTGESAFKDNGSSAVDLLLFAVFQVVRRDTIALLGHVGDVLDQISSGSMDERMMQEQLEHWRAVLSRLQRELPVLEKSMGDFFMFPYYAESKHGEASPPPPPLLNAALRELQADTAAMTVRCQKVQESLRAEMSLLESKRGIQEAESVSRLTELAFIFIPMTFAAGLFSMQIRELADNPPPAYGFVIAAAVAVALSYGLRLVQRSTVVSESLNKWEDEIRRDEQVMTRVIPIRKIAHWLMLKLRLKLLIFFVSSGSIAILVAPLWTRTAMDTSFKVVITVLALLCMLLVVGMVLWVSTSAFESLIPNRGNTVLGFGRIWRGPPRVREWETGVNPNGPNLADDNVTAGQQGNSADDGV
ncbi:hypothetical protein B0H63DRAFT_74249 [Podospora didyma]|uniref:Uncharacterized protein n=1 Tax=Podospora didyma TaxID=330526 RepID=A0AAE0N2G9_9PEZI|nr:hypothetical protein B0H63DRAFT_74249 [Podospora didyma]